MEAACYSVFHSMMKPTSTCTMMKKQQSDAKAVEGKALTKGKAALKVSPAKSKPVQKKKKTVSTHD